AATESPAEPAPMMQRSGSIRSGITGSARRGRRRRQTPIDHRRQCQERQSENGQEQPRREKDAQIRRLAGVQDRGKSAAKACKNNRRRSDADQRRQSITAQTHAEEGGYQIYQPE